MFIYLVYSVLHKFDVENKLVGQCYDGASVMSGYLTSLQASVKELMLYLHTA